jgi:hypothetical protein
MTRPDPEFAELRALLEALCEESITAEQLRRLEGLILERPEAEAYYVQYLSLHADLVSHFGVLPARAEQSVRARVGAEPPGGQRGAAPKAPPGRRRARRLLWGGLGLAGLAAGLLLALWPRPPAGPPPEAHPEASDNTVAVLLHAHGAEWEDTGLPTRPGAPLPPGWLRLKSGFAQLEFYSGAIVILEGPAELELISRTEAYCARGKLRATVPQRSQGFTIGSPKLDLVDRGTEFGLEVDQGGRTEVHVFQGKVELHNPATGRKEPPQKELTTGQGVRLDGPGPLRPIRTDPSGFLTPRGLAALSQKDLRRRQRDWLAASAALRKDPSLLVYYPFEPEHPWSRTLRDEARGRREPRDGAVVGCAWVAGRWPGKQGLEFKRVSDRVRLHVPGAFDSLTLAAWVRVDALPNRHNSLFMTDGWDDGAPHWHISTDGKISLGVQGRNKKRGVSYVSPQVFTPEQLGQWTHLAVVHDREGRAVTHYVDGRPVGKQALKFLIRLRLGDVELGNWNVGTRRDSQPIRYFSGCMDEFLLFARALSAEEIERLYAQGRPPE